MEIIDSHAHLEVPQFDEDRDAMLERARAAGVEALLAIGSGTSPGSASMPRFLSPSSTTGFTRRSASIRTTRT